jgi:hypothetical protein
MLPAMENWNRHTGMKEVICRNGLWRELIGTLLVPGRDSGVNRRYFHWSLFKPSDKIEASTLKLRGASSMSVTRRV